MNSKKVKLCIHCIHHKTITDEYYDDMTQEACFGRRSLITGNIVVNTCTSERNTNKPQCCGIEGKFYIERN